VPSTAVYWWLACPVGKLLRLHGSYGNKWAHHSDRSVQSVQRLQPQTRPTVRVLSAISFKNKGETYEITFCLSAGNAVGPKYLMY
jgi:hypothetical protein